MNPDLLKAFAERGVQLQLMGFSRAELKPILSSEMSHAPTSSEWDEVFEAMETALRDFKLDEGTTNMDLNLYLKRSEWIQTQLLSIFNSMLRNFNAMSEGKMEHDAAPGEDPEPVIPVKPADIASMGEKILKLDQDRLSARISYPKSLQQAQAAIAASDAAKGALPGPEDLVGSLYDEDDEVDADFQEAE